MNDIELLQKSIIRLWETISNLTDGVSSLVDKTDLEGRNFWGITKRIEELESRSNYNKDILPRLQNKVDALRSDAKNFQLQLNLFNKSEERIRILEAQKVFVTDKLLSLEGQLLGIKTILMEKEL